MLTVGILYGIKKALEVLLFYIEVALAKVLDMLYGMFKVFAGVEPVMYKGGKSYLFDVIFHNNIISTIYMGMAVIGIAMTFAFAIISVVKKSFDSTGEKVKATFGMILTNVFKAILLMLLMTALVSAVITATQVLLGQVDYLINNAEEMSDPSYIEFDDQDFAAMFRVIDNIGNHALNPSYNSRFNLNSCFNEIRFDLNIMAENRIFEYTYEEFPNSWQYILRQIYLAGDVTQDLPVDIYNESVSNALLTCMEALKNDGSFKPLESYRRDVTFANVGEDLGRTVLVGCTYTAAINEKYNDKPSITDALRKPYYLGDKNIYSYDSVTDSFDLSFGYWSHLQALFILIFMVIEFIKIMLNCIARIFNIVMLYLTAPGFISVMPLDDGGKVKQWTVAFTIQSFSIFGTYIAVRLMMIFIPIIMSSDLTLFPNFLQDITGRLLFIFAMCFTAEKSTSMISGILADNAGYQSVMAGDVGGGILSRGVGLARSTIGTAARVGGAALGGYARAVGAATGLSTAAKKVGGKIGNLGQAMRDKGGIIGIAKHGATTAAQDAEAKQKKEKEEEARETKNFRAQVLSALQGGSPVGGGNTSGQGTSPQAQNSVLRPQGRVNSPVGEQPGGNPPAGTQQSNANTIPSVPVKNYTPPAKPLPKKK